MTVAALKRDVSHDFAATGRADRQPVDAATWNLAAFVRHRAAYLTRARRILGCPAQAEDVVQDVMLRLIADPPQAEQADRAAYVGRMVRNLALDRARRRGFEGRLFTGLDAAPDPADPGAGTPETAAASRESLRQVAAAVAELPEPVRTAFRLHRVEGVPQIEIAARLGVSRALVCGLVRRGHLHCLAALDRRCAACPARVRKPGQHQGQPDPVGQELGRDPAGEHARVAHERRQDQERRDQRQPLRGQRHRGGPARRADGLEQGRGGEL
ncbi:sigma-70 family RNA polymerase sigma factor [Methylobacterium mesophilicum SR1.6/6]|uniref:Sigma-70 family RNA polymerase sigma factor n=1 Tax=Methylobacterium mesophilicum SR1.6/6 TaxID=908290 RepID=A0A6B9FR77_9HYPH|nr:sigma-70 family RNA polymerase sigma factor [Methylobacterium mesophilicum SR1.6/6]